MTKTDFKWLAKNLPNATRDVRTLYDAGKKIDKLVCGEVYGEGAVEFLAEELDRSVSQLSGFRKFAGQWTAVEIEQLLQKADEQGLRLTWSHFRALLAINEKQYPSEAKARSIRKKLIRHCIDKRLNYRRLQMAVQQELGVKREERPLAKPESVEKALEDFIQHTQAYLRRFDEAWFGKDGAIRPDQCPPQCKSRAMRLRNDAQRLRSKLERFLDRAAGLKEELHRAKSGKLKAKKKK